MRVLVACEFSGIVRDAFLFAGHDAVSCDLLPTESPGPHIEGDVLTVLDDGWDLMVAHPPCTYLANSGVRWLHERPERWEQMRVGAEFFRRLLETRIPRVAIENPVMHKYAVEIIGRGHDQTIQPWEHGEDASKRTCLWLRGLPPLLPTSIVSPSRETGGRVVYQNQTASGQNRLGPSPSRSKERSRFFPGIARAMVEQWATR